MGLLTLIINHESFIPSCEAGGGEIQIGEKVLLEIEPINPLWPDQIVADVERVQQGDPHGRVYTLSYCEEDLDGGPPIRECDVKSVACYTCCDELREYIDGQLIGELDCSTLTP